VEPPDFLGVVFLIDSLLGNLLPDPGTPEQLPHIRPTFKPLRACFRFGSCQKNKLFRLSEKPLFEMGCAKHAKHAKLFFYYVVVTFFRFVVCTMPNMPKHAKNRVTTSCHKSCIQFIRSQKIFRTRIFLELILSFPTCWAKKERISSLEDTATTNETTR